MASNQKRQNDLLSEVAIRFPDLPGSLPFFSGPGATRRVSDTKLAFHDIGFTSRVSNHGAYKKTWIIARRAHFLIDFEDKSQSVVAAKDHCSPSRRLSRGENKAADPHPTSISIGITVPYGA